ncbi:MAG: hypothetical protein ABJQ71_10270 [Roseibium sp.]
MLNGSKQKPPSNAAAREEEQAGQNGGFALAPFDGHNMFKTNDGRELLKAGSVPSFRRSKFFIYFLYLLNSEQFTDYQLVTDLFAVPVGI